jgi:hypothetical protein
VAPTRECPPKRALHPWLWAPHWLLGVALRAPKTKGHSTEEVRCPPESPSKRKSPVCDTMGG